jgi:SAM-dependent methyltransferase
VSGVSQPSHYAIRGGGEGRERLRTLSRVMHPHTSALLDRLGLRDGMRCLDAGCGGGDVTIELGRRVAPNGRAIGVDMDEAKLAIARADAEAVGATGVEFRTVDVRDAGGAAGYDVVYSRFLLTHLSDPEGAVRSFFDQLEPGGVIAIEDIDFSGSFAYPPSPAFARYCELYPAVVRRRGGDPDIGPRLPLLLESCGFEDVRVSVVQPVGTRGEAKLMNPMTMENIAPAVLQDGLASREEIDRLVSELYALAESPKTITGVPRIFQTWGRRPAV